MGGKCINEMVKIQHHQWAQDLYDQRRRSGLTQREWCRIHGISFNTFEYWYKTGGWFTGVTPPSKTFKSPYPSNH